MAKREDLHVYQLCATAVDKYVQARNLAILPDLDTERVLGMAGSEAGRNLCKAFMVFHQIGRFSRTMVEQALIFSPTSYPEYIQLWIRCLTPDERSEYAVKLYLSDFEGIEWDTPLYENLQRFFAQYPTWFPLHPLEPAKEPAIPLGENRHSPSMACISKMAYDFHKIIKETALLQNPGSGPSVDVYAPLDADYVNIIEGDVLALHGSVFGFSKADLDWSGARADTGRTMSASEVVVRAWIAVHHSDRLCKTELEHALVNGPAAMKSLFFTAVRLSRSTYGNSQFASILDQALAIVDQVEFATLTIPTDAAPFWECDLCGDRHDDLSMCSRCHVAAYCSRKCQKRDWSRHKHMCKRFQNAQGT